MLEIPSSLEMMKAGVHFGHQQSKRHPKMAPYIFGVRNGVHIIDLEKTAANLQTALDFITRVAANGGKIVFIGTKYQAQEVVKKYAQECQMPFIVNRWLGGTLTNFSVVIKLVKKLKDLRARKDSGEWKEKYTKKEQQRLNKELTRLEEIVGGLENLDKLPAAVFILDLKKEKTAVREAKKKGVPIIGLGDTNINPTGVNYLIPANDDGVKSIELITCLVAEAVKEGHKQIKSEAPVVEKTQDQKSNKTKKQ